MFTGNPVSISSIQFTCTKDSTWVLEYWIIEFWKRLHSNLWKGMLSCSSLPSNNLFCFKQAVGSLIFCDFFWNDHVPITLCNISVSLSIQSKYKLKYPVGSKGIIKDWHFKNHALQKIHGKDPYEVIPKADTQGNKFSSACEANLG